MRSGLIIGCALAICVVAIVFYVQPFDGENFSLVGLGISALVFISVITGMLAARVHMRYRAAHKRAEKLGLINIILDEQVKQRTRALSLKVAELEEARAAAVEANTAKSAFLATMSHELRTPLNAILGFSELIRGQMYGAVGDRRYVEYAGHINDSGSHLLSLIHDILDLSKIEAGKMEIHPEPLNVPDVIAEARRLAGARGRDAKHTILCDIDEDAPLLMADRRASVQMIVNLLSNAMKFTPEHGRIFVSAVTREDGGISISVTDTGVGIAQSEIPKALSAFGQAKSGEARAHEGTGLGLPIVNSLMNLHGGTMALESELGRGTCVSLHFPAERSLGRAGDTQAA